jgi:hypothetical protein
MQADNSQLLAQLRDIHAAQSPGWWPPAPGWWVLVVLVLVLLVIAGRLVVRQLRQRRRRRLFMVEIDRLRSELDPSRDAREFLAGVNRVFRVVAMKAFPDTACASLQGDDWVTFISSLLPETTDTTSLSVLARGPYEAAPKFDQDDLIEHARTWVKAYG